MKGEMLKVENIKPGDSLVLTKGDQIEITNVRPRLFGIFKLAPERFVIGVADITVVAGFPTIRLDVVEIGNG